MTELNRRILIIDDDREIWRAYQGILDPAPLPSGSDLERMNVLLSRHDEKDPNLNAPFMLTCAGQGQEGLAMVEAALANNQPFALAFIDVRMPPGWDGMETAVRIRACDPRIEIVIATAYSDRSCEEIVRAVGTPSKLLFVRKPFDPEEIRQLAVALTDKWNVALREEAQRRELEEKITTLETMKKEQEVLQNKLHQAQKMEAIGLMAGGVAHDLNNILSGIINYPQLMRLHLPPENVELHRYVTATEKAGLRAAAVVADLLTVARGVAMVRQPADLNRLIMEHLESPEGKRLQELYPQVEILTDLTEGAVLIDCSQIHIKKCLMNLLTNAVEAIIGSGTVLISTSRFACKRADNNKERIALTVKDSGPGVAAEDLEHIFEPFYSKKELGRSGTGLGLAVVWNCVQHHEGTIEVKNNEQGTTFTITFPCTEQTSMEAKEKTELEDLLGSGTILVVDDEEQPRDIAVTLLTMLGYTVEAVASGEAAIEFVEKRPVDLLYLDMIMNPGINGYETFKRIEAIYPKQKAILVSGFSEETEMNKARTLGIKGFVCKPFTLEELGSVVHAIMTDS